LTFLARSSIMCNMNILPTETRVRILAALVEGSSMRSTSRMVGVSINTVMKFVADFGPVCERFHNERVRGLKTARLQCDEIWSFCYCKKKNTPADLKGVPGFGDVWTWTILDADSKLMVSWLVGDRTNHCASAVLFDAAERIDGDRVQVTSDGYRFYQQAVGKAFAGRVDYAELNKIFGAADGYHNARYSPAICIGCVRKHVIGKPDDAHVSTSYVERQNLTMRMGMRRFTRLTNGFSKKLENHRAAVAIHFAYYNWARVHKSLRVTPAMEAGLTDHVWELEELVGLMEAEERAVVGTPGNQRGPYRKDQ
jgi:IS1 family transposase